MLYTTTTDEKSTGFYSTNPYYYADAPNSLLTTFQLAPGYFNTAYGLLTASGYAADTDVYKLGYLTSGMYSFSTSNSYWFYGAGFSNYVSPIINIYNSGGVSVATGYFGSLTYSVSSPGTYYVAVSGSAYSSSQYELSYAYTAPTNTPAVFSNISILGPFEAGGIVYVGGQYYDANGTTTSTPRFSWYIDAAIISIGNEYQIKASDIGKIISVVISIIDDAGYYESYSIAKYVTGADITAPTVSSFSPTDAATNVAVTDNIVLTFSETIARGTGTIEIRSGSAGGTMVESFNAASSSLLTFSGSTLTIDPMVSLANSTQYFVVFASGAVKDAAGNSYLGTSTYDFTTVAAANTAAPIVSSFSPTDAAINVAITDNVVLTFSETIARGTGNIEIRSGSAGGTLVETFNAASSGFDRKSGV